MSDYVIPDPNPDQVFESEPSGLKAVTRDIDDVLDYVAKTRKLNPGVKVYAADDNKWLRVGFRMEFPSGNSEYICAKAEEAYKYGVLKHSASRAVVATYLEEGQSPQEALDRALDVYNKAWEIYKGHYSSVQLALTRLVREARSR